MNEHTNTLDVDGKTLHYRAAGSGTPLVFVHGSAGGARQWKRLYAHFGDTRRVFAYDLLGCGRNRPLFVDVFHGDVPAIDDRPFTFTDDARALSAAIDRLGQPVDVVAHSVGGIGALLTALEQPAAIRTLTLFEPVLFMLLRDSADSAFEPVRAIALQYRRLFEHKGQRAAMEAFVNFWNGAGHWQRLSEPVRQSMLAGANRLYLEWGIVLYGRSDLRVEDLTRVRPPVLYFCGAKTIEPVKRVTGIAATRLPNCRTVTLLGAGHMAPFTHADSAIPIIEDHIRDDVGAAQRRHRDQDVVRDPAVALRKAS